MEGMLSQDEINALLSGMSDEPSDEQVEDNVESLSDIEGDAIGEISNISMGTAATTLYSLVNRKVTISTPIVSITNWKKLSESYDRPCVFIQISYTTGLFGRNILILKEKDVKIITDLMMGGDGTNIDGELGELHLSAIGEAMNQMMGSSATSLSSMINKKIDISTPNASLVDMNETIDAEDIDSFLKQQFVKITFKMEIGDLVDSEIMQLYPIDFAKELYESFASNMEEVEGEQVQQMTQQPLIQQQPVQQPIQQPVQQPIQQPMQQPMQQQPMQQQPMQQQPIQQQPMQQQVQPNMMYGQQNINVQPAQFQAFSNDVEFGAGHENIDLIMDVPLEVTVELGRTRKYIHEILDFAPGTIIELNKIAGEPIDVLVNGKLVAKGEVVVIDESFGVRVTEIIR